MSDESSKTGLRDRTTTPLWVFWTLAGLNVVLALVVSLTGMPAWIDFSIVGVQVVALVAIIGMGVRNQRIFRARIAAIRTGWQFR